jgi:hypothetical protein
MRVSRDQNNRDQGGLHVEARFHSRARTFFFLWLLQAGGFSSRPYQHAALSAGPFCAGETEGLRSQLGAERN